VASLKPRLFLAAVLAITLGIWVSVGATIGLLYTATAQLPDSQAVQAVGTMPHATTIVDVKGRHAFTIFQEQRLPVPLSRISPHLVGAIIAVEDQRFYRHGGFDVIRVLGAGWNNVLEGRAEQGGSTITQQLARLSFLTSEKTLRRKLQEVILATRLERAFTKDQILEMYLNKAYFGDGLYGVEAASLGYFGKHASDVSAAEAALIAGLVKAPSTYAPTVSPERAIARRNLVLRVMRDSRALDAAAFDRARNQPLVLNDALRQQEAYGQYFKEEVRKQLVERFGWDRVYQGGLKVETTLDLAMQKAAEAEVARALADIEHRLGPRARQLAASDPLQAALVALDPRNGEVRALVGGREFGRSRFNRVTQAKRQPGSAFKPFVYAAALEEGYTPATVLRGLAEPIVTPAGAWIPEDGHVEDEALSMRAALRVSSNRAAVRMLEQVGVGAVVRQADRFGLSGLPAVPSLALGSGELTMLSLVSAYGAFANAGIVVPPTLIRRVSDGAGRTLYEAAPEPRQVVSPATAYLVTSMLADVVNAGTGAQVRPLGFHLPAAGKTGTTNDYRDAWFIGYTPQLLTGVWVGHDQPRTIIERGYAAQLAVPLWTRFMIAATRGSDPARFSVPRAVTTATICPLSGRLATDACRRHGAGVHTEYFHRGTEPIDYCTDHILHDRSTMTLAATTVGPVAPAVSAPVVEAPAVAAVAEQTTEPPVEPRPAPQKKRGFWSRVFGIGR